MLRIPQINTLTNKEPWLAASLSWFLPGIGHLYLGTYGLGAILLLVGSLIHIFWIISLLSTWAIFIPIIILSLSSSIFLPVYSSWSAFRLTKRHNTEDFERERTITKDPWLAVFLSVVLPGLGHIYLRKWIVGILSFLGLFVIVFTALLMEFNAHLAIIVYQAFVSVHAYIACQVNKIKPKQPLVLFIIVYIFIGFPDRILLPQLEKRFVYNVFSLSGISMNPTLVKGDSVIVNIIIYRFNNPKPGDVIMFYPPNNVPGKKDTVCKRIIAVAGETIKIYDDNVYVDGQERNYGFQTNSYTYPESNLSADSISENDHPYRTYGIDEPYHVPEGYYFVLGDNRQNSEDSRWHGAIAKEKIIGKVVKIYWPPRRMGVVR